MLLLVTPPDADTEAPAYALDEDDRRLLDALMAGDEQAFADLVRRYQSPLLRVAMSYVRPRSAAEEVVQETWLGVLRGLPGFEGRSSLRTWIFRILANRARTRGARESRSVPFSALGDGDADAAVDPARFAADGSWASPPPGDIPDAALLTAEARVLVLMAIEQLPPQQRAVITLRDVEGWSAAEVREALELSEGNERVLLHRARAKVRAALEPYFAEAVA
jgi:RNA polymerase sigma-70 factor, ECF subfamily